jgi:outer membrane lipoprotein SlyB
VIDVFNCSFVKKGIIMIKRTNFLTFFFATTLVLFSGCSKKERNTAVGAGLGVATGAVIGSALGNTEGALIGGALGGITGGLIGNSTTKDDSKSK